MIFTFLFAFAPSRLTFSVRKDFAHKRLFTSLSMLQGNNTEFGNIPEDDYATKIWFKKQSGLDFRFIFNYF
jgi:hypothetical protein